MVGVLKDMSNVKSLIMGKCSRLKCKIKKESHYSDRDIQTDMDWERKQETVRKLVIFL